MSFTNLIVPPTCGRLVGYLRTIYDISDIGDIAASAHAFANWFDKNQLERNQKNRPQFGGNLITDDIKPGL